MVGTELRLSYKLESTVYIAGERVNAGTTIDTGNLVQADAQFFIRGRSLWLHPQDQLPSNFDLTANTGDAQAMRNTGPVPNR